MYKIGEQTENGATVIDVKHISDTEKLILCVRHECFTQPYATWRVTDTSGGICMGEYYNNLAIAWRGFQKRYSLLKIKDMENTK